MISFAFYDPVKNEVVHKETNTTLKVEQVGVFAASLKMLGCKYGDHVWLVVWDDRDYESVFFLEDVGVWDGLEQDLERAVHASKAA